MGKPLRFAENAIIITACALALSCATTRQKTDTYIFADPLPLTRPIDAWLRTIEIVSNNLPLTEEYALVSDSLAAIASRHEFLLSSARGDQPYIVDLIIHERSYTVDLATSHSVMAVLNMDSSTDASPRVARVVYTAVTPESIVSLYQVTEICEKMLASLRKAMIEEAEKAREKQKKDSGIVTPS
ncbi:MAG: hypothetical protein ABSF77_10860 [Spirochaetia bacterium]